MKNEIFELKFGGGRLRLLYKEVEKTSRGRRQDETEAIGRLLEAAVGRDAVLIHSDEGKPFIKTSHGRFQEQISVSHSRELATILLSSGENSVGVDVEDLGRGDKLKTLAARVFTKDEIEVYGSLRHGLVLAWTLKEAAFKASDNHPVDFLNSISLPLNVSEIRDAEGIISYDFHGEKIRTCAHGIIRCINPVDSFILAEYASMFSLTESEQACNLL